MSIQKEEVYSKAVHTKHGDVTFKHPATSEEDFVRKVKEQLSEALSVMHMEYPEVKEKGEK